MSGYYAPGEAISALLRAAGPLPALARLQIDDHLDAVDVFETLSQLPGLRALKTYVLWISRATEQSADIFRGISHLSALTALDINEISADYQDAQFWLFEELARLTALQELHLRPLRPRQISRCLRRSLGCILWRHCSSTSPATNPTGTQTT